METIILWKPATVIAAGKTLMAVGGVRHFLHLFLIEDARNPGYWT